MSESVFESGSARINLVRAKFGTSEDLNMNRRKLLAAGIGLGTLAFTSKSSQACGDEEDKQAKLTGPIYCPLFPYLFCGSYTLYYAVEKVGTTCGANPASMAGPNELVLGCNGDCQPTFKASLTGKGVRVGGTHVSHKKIKDDGIATLPTSVGRIDGVHIIKKIFDVKNRGGQHLFYARVYNVTMKKSELDKSELLRTMTQEEIDLIADELQYFPGHESGPPTTGETPIVAERVSTNGHTCVVKSSEAGNQQYLVVLK